MDEDLVPDMSPCWSHSFLIDQIRDVPLMKLPVLPGTDRFVKLAGLIKNSTSEV